ncbi:sensor histidine kinase [Candidatus Nitrosocosmicus hydrocola]|uniref:sensor histidine kinase n=1 Tax=Candidatus Nitrosocosmicus hydrocola TaxID=1826872 RepID=UPI000A58B0CA|nr:HAMP domain-containing sensor histidine kinase [Candidatus Nitrosocosmicus hydrocola]
MGKGFLFFRRKKITIASIVLIIAVSYFLLFYQQYIAEQNIRDRIFLDYRNNQIETTKALSEHVSSDLRLVSSILQGLSDSIYLQQGELYGDRVGNLIEKRFNQINNISKIDGLFIADENNIIVYNKVSEGQRSFVNIDISLREYVNETRNTLSPTFSNGFEGIDGIHKIALTFPIINMDSKRYQGMVGVEIPSVDFFGRYGNVYNVNSTFLVTYDRNSDYVSTPRTNFLGQNLFGDQVQTFFHFNEIQNKYYQSVFDGQLVGGYAIYDFGTGERLNTGYPVSIDAEPRYFVFIITPTASVYQDINETLSNERTKFFLLIASITAAILILISFLVKLNSLLNELVDKRTKELERSNQSLKIANEHLNVHDRMQKEFINTAAHELRTPIQLILGAIEAFKDSVKNDKQKELSNIIIRNAERLKKLAEDILDVTRIESNSLDLKKESFDLYSLIEDIVKEHSNLSDGNQKIKFEFNISPNNSPLTIIGDENRIGQVITNLVNNSIKFISKENGDGNDNHNGRISISVEKTKSLNTDDTIIEEVLIGIKDNGKGIDLEIFPRLFTKFATKSFRGTGLGLFIAKNIVEAHGGRIWGQNNNDGKGATFYFTLPLTK